MTTLIRDKKYTFVLSWVAFEALRRLGFLSEDIYFMASEKDDYIELAVQLKTQGKEFIIGIGGLRIKAEQLQAEWAAFFDSLKSYSNERLQIYWDSSSLAQDPTPFLKKLLDAGFQIPNNRN